MVLHRSIKCTAWILSSCLVGVAVAYVGSLHMLTILFGWSRRPGWLVVGLVVVAGVIASLRQKLTPWTVVSLGLLIASTVVDLSEPFLGLWAAWIGLSVALCAVGAAAQLKSGDALTALAVWAIGTYIQAVYEYTLLMLPTEFMRFFSGGYIT